MKKRIIFLWLLIQNIQANASTFTVTNTNNSGAGSLYQAIIDANTAGGNSTINFNIPGAAPHIIAPTTFYSTGVPRNRVYAPFVFDNITLDATTQSGYTPGSPAVIIDCTGITGGSCSCLAIVGASNCIIKGIGICNLVNSGSGRGISIENSLTQNTDNNQIIECVLGVIAAAPPFGNTRGIVAHSDFVPGLPITNTLLQLNVLSGNSIAGAQFDFNVLNTTIENNYIGCNFGGTTAVGNAYGLVFIGEDQAPCTGNIIQNNVISGNSTFGVVLQALCSENTIQNNMIGLNASGTSVVGSTQIGVLMVGVGADACDNNTVENNIIGGCSANGIYITDNASNNIVNNNYIGTNSSNTNLANGGSGVVVQGDTSGPCLANQFNANTIEYNGFLGSVMTFTTFSSSDGPLVDNPDNGNGLGAGDNFGIYLLGSSGDPDILNAMLANNISLNASNGIELQNNSNDNQEPPTINSAGVCANESALTVSITAPSTPAATNFRLDLFANTINRNPITEGARFIDFIDSVPSGQTVVRTFNVSSPILVPGNFLSATATNLNNGGAPGDTSEYSLNSLITTFTAPIVDSLTADPNPICAGDSSELTLAFTPGTSSGPFFVSWSDGVLETALDSPVNRIVTPPATTNYQAFLSDSLSCTAQSMVITVTVNPLPSITLTASNTQIQIGESVILTATPSGNGPFTLEWSDGLIQTGVIGAVSRTFTPLWPTTYSVQVIDANGCTAGTSIFIIVGCVSPISLAIYEKYCLLPV